MEEFDLKEQATIDVRRRELGELHNKYLHQHPELEQILNDFISEVLVHKPEDVIGFAKNYFAKFNPTPVRTRPLAIVGPSGVGKTTLVSRIQTDFPGAFEFSVSCTTRAPRPDEVDGKDYYFITREEFQARIEQGEFIEWAEVHGNLYGTSLKVLEEIASNGRVCLLDIDVQGATQIYQTGLEFNIIFIIPKNMKQLEERMRARGENDEGVLRTRLRNAQAEIEAARNNPLVFRDFVVNDQLEAAVEEFYYYIFRYYEFLKEWSN